MIFNTAQRYINRQVLMAVLFVTIAFLGLFFFFDAIDELPSGNNANQLSTQGALLYVAMLMPGHLYELMPIAVLIGTIFVMTSLAQNSEFTILRTSGLSPARALRILLAIGALFGAFTFVVGDYAAPYFEKMAKNHKAKAEGNLTTGLTGAWMKETHPGVHRIVNVRQLAPNGELHQVRIFNFDDAGNLTGLIKAPTATATFDGKWTLNKAENIQLTAASDSNQQSISIKQDSTLSMDSGIGQGMVASALLRPESMSTMELYTYIGHLKNNNQSAQAYEIQFWRKVFYPLSCLVMVMLALPFAYLHFRAGNITSAVFGGVVIGISFFLMNNVFGYIGNLNGWTPWLAAALPSLLYTGVSLLAFNWLVQKR